MSSPALANGPALPLPTGHKTMLTRTRALALALLLHAAGAAMLWGMGLTNSPFPLPQGDMVQVALYAPANNLAGTLGGNLAGTGNGGGSTGAAPAQAANPPLPTPQAAPATPEQARRPPPDATPRPATRQTPPRRDRRQDRDSGQDKDREMAHTGGTTDKPSQAAPGTEGTKDTGAQGGGTGGGTGHGTATGLAPAPLGRGVNPHPRYPELARQRGQQGVVLLRVQVDARGMPTHVLVQQSSGYSLLDEAARDTVRRWRFSPALRLGQPVPGAVAVPVHFRLR